MLKILKRFFRSISLVSGCTLLLINLSGCQNASSQSPPAYGTKVTFGAGRPLMFPDVTLEFVGQRWVDTSPNYPRGFTYYDFKVRQGDQEQTISWSAGTGDIGPTSFEVGGQDYLLELAMSDKLGSLAENELVLWKE